METLYDEIIGINIGNTTFEKYDISEKLKIDFGEDIKSKIDEIVNIDNKYDTKKIIGIIFDLINNSINTNSSKLRIKISFNKEKNDLIIGVSDNGEGKNASDNNELFTSIGGAGGLIKSLKVLSKNRTRLIKSEKGASILSKINLDDFNDRFNSDEIKIIVEEGKKNINEKGERMNIFYKKVINDMLIKLSSSGISEEQIELILNDFIENKISLIKSENDYKKV